jgi:hypothetical protein
MSFSASRCLDFSAVYIVTCVILYMLFSIIWSSSTIVLLLPAKYIKFVQFYTTLIDQRNEVNQNKNHWNKTHWSCNFNELFSLQTILKYVLFWLKARYVFLGEILQLNYESVLKPEQVATVCIFQWAEIGTK